MEIDIPKVYEPQKVEDKWYDYWLKHNLFSSTPRRSRQPFSIVIPPPNVTGILHMGHALNNTLQDVIIRFRGMQNYNTLWVPGTDHGGIATQNVVEKLLLAEGKTRHDLGREKFLERMWKWRKESGDIILSQLKRLGCSLDWSRTRFTMDDVCSRAVRHAFVELYNRGLIYRGKRLVNWCPRCQTALSDIEVEHEEEEGKLWHIKYPLKKPKKGGVSFIVVATTRPETMLGDVAVAVSPGDKRYENIVGEVIVLPIVNREIPVIEDEAVDPAFGTGAVKVTPAHDPTDFDIGARHKLESIVVIDTQGKMTKDAGSYAGIDRYAARKAVLGDLALHGLLLETTDHRHAVGRCYRCNTVIEPLISEQWFLKVEDMSRRAMEVVEQGKIKFYPDSWKGPYLSWLEKLKDWCISRQIWWGHRIPVYYCGGKGAPKKAKDKRDSSCPPIAAVDRPTSCPECGGTVIEQDTDVLDTWFSSALWPFSVFGWPVDKTGANQAAAGAADSDYYYPTAVLVTGHEILYLWVARMVQMGLQLRGDVPFREVFIHGIVRDKNGKKMSKSLGNIIDPLEIMNKYGTDALRFSLAQSAAPGRDMQLSDDSFVSARNFANKIWNASRFVMMNIKSSDWQPGFLAVWPLELADVWILSQYRLLVKDVTDALAGYNIDTAARLLYEFFWSKYCDWYIEIAKIRLNGQDPETRRAALSVLLEVLAGTLRLLHPIMPFITEEIWDSLVKFKESSEDRPVSIMKYPWPEADQSKVDTVAISKMELLQEIVTAVRTIRSEMNVPPGKSVSIHLNVNPLEQQVFSGEGAGYLKQLAKAQEILVGESLPRPAQSAMAVVSNVQLFVPLAGLIDLEKEKQRLLKEHKNAGMELERCKKNMENADFMKRAPQAEVDKMRQRMADAQLKIERIGENIKFLE